MNTLQDRLQQFLAYLGIPMQSFERECGIGQGLGAKLSIKSYATTFKRISDAYPNLNIEWLKTGDGEMINQASSKALIDIKDVEDSFNDSNVLEKFLEIIREKDRMIEERDKRIAQLTDKLLGL